MKSATKKRKAVPGPEAVPAPAGQETHRIKRLLVPLLREIGARWVVLVGLDGRPVAQHGEPGTFDPVALAPIMAGALQTMRHVARHFGGEYSVMLNHGRRDNVQLSLVAEKLILAIVFGNQAPVGAARLAALQVTKKLEEVLGGSRGRGLGPDYAARAKAKLDELLG